MEAMGVEVSGIAAQNGDEQGKHQVNDKHDAQGMCRRLSEYLGGHDKALSIVRIPWREEEARRGRDGCAINCGASCGGCRPWEVVCYCNRE